MSMRVAARLAALLLATVVAPVGAQDSLPPAPAVLPVLQPLPLDTSRLAPFFATFDVLVDRGDSTLVIGQRYVGMSRGHYAGQQGWLLVERRTGSVPAVDSLWLSAAAQPLFWSSRLGPGSITAQFVNDTLFGEVTIGRTQVNIVLPGRPDLLATGAMTDLVLGLLPLDGMWADSVGLLEITPAAARVIPGEIVVVAREPVDVGAAAGPPLDAWVVAIRAPNRQMLYWVDVATGAVLRAQQNLPPHLGSMVEFRAHPPPRLMLPLFWP